MAYEQPNSGLKVRIISVFSGVITSGTMSFPSLKALRPLKFANVPLRDGLLLPVVHGGDCDTKGSRQAPLASVFPCPDQLKKLFNTGILSQSAYPPKLARFHPGVRVIKSYLLKGEVKRHSCAFLFPSPELVPRQAEPGCIGLVCRF